MRIAWAMRLQVATMDIEIAERLHPFTTRPGTPFLLPLSSYRVRVYPTLVAIDDMSGPLPKETATIRWEVTGPVEGFTVVQELERCEIKVFGQAKEGFFRYTLSSPASGKGVVLSIERAPQEGLKYAVVGPLPVMAKRDAPAGNC